MVLVKHLSWPRSSVLGKPIPRRPGRLDLTGCSWWHLFAHTGSGLNLDICASSDCQ